MLRTNYTVKSNREWNELFRNNRIERKTLERMLKNEVYIRNNNLKKYYLYVL